MLLLFVAPPWIAGAEQPEVKVSQQRDGDVIQIFAENVSDKSLTITLLVSDIHNAKSDGWPTKAVKRCLPGDSVMMTALIECWGAPPATFTCTVSTSPAAQAVSQPGAPANSAPAPAGRAQNPTPNNKETPRPTVPVDPDFGYRLPFRIAGVSCNVSQGYNGRRPHQGLYALDFDMPEGSVRYAPQGRAS